MKRRKKKKTSSFDPFLVTHFVVKMGPFTSPPPPPILDLPTPCNCISYYIIRQLIKKHTCIPELSIYDIYTTTPLFTIDIIFMFHANTERIPRGYFSLVNKPALIWSMRDPVILQWSISLFKCIKSGEMWSNSPQKCTFHIQKAWCNWSMQNICHTLVSIILLYCI